MSSAARIEELQKKFDENPRRYFAPLANECRKAGDLDAAIAICRAHLPQQPGHMSGHIVYGQALFESGELGEARTVFETALGLDPENLIALRHMGDIAAGDGDFAAARQWYSRVLETDPRNEEIQALLAGLDQGSGTAAGHGLTEPPAAPAEDHSEFPGIETSFDEASTESLLEPDEPRKVRGGLPTLVDPALVAAAADAISDGDADPLPASAASDLAFLDLTEADSGIDPLVTTETEAAEGVTAPREELLEPTSLEFEMPSVDAGPLEGLEATTFEAPSAADVSEFDRVGDEALLDGLDAATPPLEGLEVAEFDASAYGHTDFEPVAPPPEFAPAEADLAEASPMGQGSGEAFVTETMAELYLRQGYRDEALGVYRKLVQQSPGDGELRSRMEQLERELASAGMGEAAGESSAWADEGDTLAGLPRAMDPALVAASAEAAPAETLGAGDVPTGPTIRQFLAALAAGDRLMTTPGGEIADVADPGAIEALPSLEESPDEDSEPESVLAHPPAVDAPSSMDEEVAEPDHARSADAEVRSLDAGIPDTPAELDDPQVAPAREDGLDSLFGGAASPDDQEAADTLAAAYLAPPAESEPTAAPEPVESAPDPLRGRPARPAGSDLSLDHVFGAPRQGGATRNTGSFSFDQFFSEGAVKPAREDAQEPSANPGDAEDLEQFNSWLHNLRKQ